ncbi:unnamed protein product [Trypanosoma congolense IL3000]|uniref:WGS project CAEQ00000000 data, annotated contig 2287 n=1 Tax=Trypanosoma congolense (strain IL3000) TaxID=1068625 RepID=F9WCX1_TRYCI|nr:unnamed protein product [Trypanosoma congolense IL3000]
MLKHRDNLSYPPFTVDPKGNGVTTMGSNSTGEQQQQEAPNDINVAAGTSAVAGKKRNRDIRGLDRFKQVVYGEKGLPRFHAMVSRHPVLMYPPEGTDIARRKALAERKEKAAQQPTVRNPQQPSWSPDDDTLSMFDETRIEEEDLQSALNYMDSHALQDTVAHRDGNGVATPEAPSASNNDNVTDGDGNRAKDLGNDFAAKYHHRQLDALVGLYYEFNHLTFMKLPMNDTLQLLRRCGRSGTGAGDGI